MLQCGQFNITDIRVCVNIIFCLMSIKQFRCTQTQIVNTVSQTDRHNIHTQTQTQPQHNKTWLVIVFASLENQFYRKLLAIITFYVRLSYSQWNSPLKYFVVKSLWQACQMQFCCWRLYILFESGFFQQTVIVLAIDWFTNTNWKYFSECMPVERYCMGNSNDLYVIWEYQSISWAFRFDL